MEANATTLIAKIISAISTKTVTISSPYEIIVTGMTILETYPTLTGEQKQTMLVQALNALAKGPDECGATSGVIPDSIIKALDIMIENNLAQSVITIISDASKGRYDINLTVSSCCKFFRLFYFAK